MDGTHQVLAYADDVNLIGDDIRTIQRNTNMLLKSCKDIGSGLNTGKTKYRCRMSSRHDGNEHIAVGNHLYEKGKTVKYLGSLLANQNSIPEEVKCRL